MLALLKYKMYFLILSMLAEIIFRKTAATRFKHPEKEKTINQTPPWKGKNTSETLQSDTPNK